VRRTVEPCGCGRTHGRIWPLGRKSDEVIVDGNRGVLIINPDDETREIPVLFLSARSDNADQVRGHETGGVGYITKPFDPLAMTNTVQSVLKRVRRGERDAMRREWKRSIAAD